MFMYGYDVWGWWIMMMLLDGWVIENVWDVGDVFIVVWFVGWMIVMILCDWMGCEVECVISVFCLFSEYDFVGWFMCQYGVVICIGFVVIDW